MVNNIPEILQSRKVVNYILILILVLLGGISFGLGRLSAGESTHTEVVACSEYTETSLESTSLIPSSTVQGQYVASKNGSAYHFPWCPGAKQISTQNILWFDTKIEAEEAGYRPASNCKGL